MIFRNYMIYELIYLGTLIINLLYLSLYKYKDKPFFNLDIDEYETLYVKILITLLIFTVTFVLYKKDQTKKI